MGFLNQNTTYLGNDITFPVVEGYCGSVGAAIAAVEGQQNNFAMFEAALTADFQEACALREGADIAPLQEASIGGVVAKIIEFFKKLGAKIKSIFESFMAKLDSYLKKDTKDFVNKYKKTVVSKSDYSKMKAKYAAPKTGDYVYSKEYGDIEVKTGAGTLDDFSREDYIEDLCKRFGGADKTSELQSSIKELMYDDEEVKDDWTLASINTVMNRLLGADKAVSALRKTNDGLQKSIKKVISELTKEQNANAKKLPGEGAEADAAIKAQSDIGLWQQRASAHQTVILAFSSAVMNVAKFGIAQDRRIFAQAVAHNPKTVKEDAMLFTAIGECAEAEAYEAFDAMEVA